MHELIALFFGGSERPRTAPHVASGDAERADDSDAFVQDWIRVGGQVLPGVIS